MRRNTQVIKDWIPSPSTPASHCVMHMWPHCSGTINGHIIRFFLHLEVQCEWWRSWISINMEQMPNMIKFSLKKSGWRKETCVVKGYENLKSLCCDGQASAFLCALWPISLKHFPAVPCVLKDSLSFRFSCSHSFWSGCCLQRGRYRWAAP